MKSVFEKIIERLKEIKQKSYELRGKPHVDYGTLCGWISANDKAIEIVNQIAEEYGDGWIPVEDRLPENYGTYIIWWTDLSKQEYYEMAEYDPEDGWLEDIPQAINGCYKVIAWRPLPEPYKFKKK